MINILSAAITASQCLLPSGAGDDASTQHDAYAARSVEIVTRAQSDDQLGLSELIDTLAEFSLGAGDVGIPLGLGVPGAVALARELEVESYSFNGWDNIPTLRDPCGEQSVEIEFLTAQGTRAARITFRYEHGLLTSASGWWHSRHAGIVPHEEPSR